MSRCPHCTDQSLTRASFEGVEVDACPKCRGMFCDSAELGELLGEDLDPRLLPMEGGEAAAGGPPCPNCGDTPLSILWIGEESPFRLLDCRDCFGLWLNRGVLEKLRARNAELRDGVRREAAVPSRSASSRPALNAAGGRREWTPVQVDGQLPYDTLGVNALALPAAFLLALFINFTPTIALLYPILIVVHELGHAMVAWMCGIMAIPLPIGFTVVGGSRNAFLGLVVSAGIIALIRLGVRDEKRLFTGIFGGALLLQLYLTWLIDETTASQWITYGGIGAEIMLSAFCIAAFYYRAPDVLRWDFWRYFVLVPFASTFVYQAALWRRVRANLDHLPIGSNITGARDGSSDIEKLLQRHGWTTEQVIDSYERLLWLGAVVLLAHYGVFLVRAWQLRNDQS